MNNELYVIGNGFDLHHGLNTSYYAFSKYLKENDNELYYKVVETFYKYDLEGYKTDSNFNNMFDDGLHTFYAAHCDVFITNDDRCKYKAEKTYEKLHIKTLVIKSNEIEKIKNYG